MTDELMVQIEPDWENYFEGVFKKGDTPIYWSIQPKVMVEKGIKNAGMYMGVALIRNNKVLYYDRYPMGGGPFKIKDFKDSEFRNRCKIIADHVERAFNEVQKENLF